MPQVAPFLKPDKPASSPPRPPRGDEPDGGDGGGGGGQPVRLPIAGFWRRVGALLFDLVGLFVVMRLVGWMFREPLLNLGEIAPWVSTFLAFLYFALGNGPVGKGRTVGKLLTGIRTTNLDGGTPSFLQGAMRTLILFPAFVPALLIRPLVAEEDSFMVGQFLVLLQGFLNLSVIAGSVFAIIFNPFKQGFHDYFAKTLVRPSAAPQLTFDELTSIVDGAWRRLQVQAQINGAIPAAVIFGFMVIMLWPPKLYNSGLGQRLELQRDLLKQLELAEGDLQNVTLLPDVPDESLSSEAQDVYQAFVTDIADPLSTEPLRLRMLIAKTGSWSMTDEELEMRMRGLAVAYRTEVYGKLPPEAFFTRLETPPTNFAARPLKVDVTAFEALDLFLFPVYMGEVAKVEVLVEPTEEFIPPPPEETPEEEAGTTGEEFAPEAGETSSDSSDESNRAGSD